MKKRLLISVFIGALLLMAWHANCLLAQKGIITVPDYTYGTIHSQYGTVTPQGVPNPGPYGGYSEGENERSSGLFLANGFRWWSYPGTCLIICGDFPVFNYPGYHGIWDMTSIGCIDPPIGYMASWGGVITDPASRKIWSLTGSQNHNGPTEKYCDNPGPHQWCYNIPSDWGGGASYGYLRKVVVVQSTGVLKKGDPVNIKASITAKRVHESEGTATSKGVFLMNKLSATEWLKWGFGREYLKWGDVEDIMGTSSVVNSMLAVLQVNQNNTDDSTVTVAIGDTIVLELIFQNTIKLANPHNLGVETEGWAGSKPTNLFANIRYTRTDSIKNLILKHGNTLTYDLVSLTQGALLNPLTPNGPNVDEDKDGISDAREKGADGNNSTFDGNGDLIPDYKQANVASFHTYNGENYVTLEVPSGKMLSQLKVTDNPSPANKPADAEFPWGFFDFSIDGLDPGEAVTVTLTLHNAVPVSKYYKYGLTPDNPQSHWYDFTYDGQTGAEISGNDITLHFVDGLRGDDDITVNGSIREPGGPAKSVTTGISELIEKSGIIVYPNPVTNKITIKLNNILPGNNYLLNIHSNTGKIIQQRLINVCDVNEEFVIPTNNFPGGIYLITLSNSNRVYKTKFIKLK